MYKQIFSAKLICIGTALVTGLAAQVSTADTVTVGKAWPANQRVSIDQIGHAPFSELLTQYVDNSGRVDYTGWKAAPNAQQSLTHYLESLSRAELSSPASREAKLAFWINAYNALTIHGILREYPTSSIRNHTPRLFGYNIWDDLQLVVGDQQFSLNQIEHEILRKMDEHRIHFAIVCASIGCPRLLNEAYTADRLEVQLTDNSQNFFADPNRFQADEDGAKLSVSPILLWFGKDFGATPEERMQTIAPYLPNAAARELATSGKAKLAFLDYDWDLNDQATAKEKD